MALLQVVRDGRPVKISIYDIVVGDVVPLNIGDQVTAFLSIACFVEHEKVFFSAYDVTVSFIPGARGWYLNYRPFSCH